MLYVHKQPRNGTVHSSSLCQALYDNLINARHCKSDNMNLQHLEQNQYDRKISKINERTRGLIRGGKDYWNSRLQPQTAV